MKVPQVKVIVKFDVYSAIPRVVPAHELLLLRVMEAEKNCQLSGIEAVPGKYFDIESAAEEYDRMDRKYRRDSDGERWVIKAFGRLHEGSLEKAMLDGVEAFTPKKKPRRKTTVVENPKTA